MTTTKIKKTTKAISRASKQTADEKYLGLTEQELNRFREACRRTLNAIAYDVMSAGVEVKGNVMRREHAIEVALSEGRLLTYGTFNTAQTPRDEKDWVRFYDERIQPMLDKHYGTPAFNRMMKKVFPVKFNF